MKRLFSIFFFFIIALSSVVGHTHPKDGLEAEIHEKYGIIVSKSDDLTTAGYLYFLREFLIEAKSQELDRRYFPHDDLRKIIVFHHLYIYYDTCTIRGNVITAQYDSAKETVSFIRAQFPLADSIEAVALSLKNQAIRRAILDRHRMVKETYDVTTVYAPKVKETKYTYTGYKETDYYIQDSYIQRIPYENQEELLGNFIQLIARLESGKEHRSFIDLPEASYDHSSMEAHLPVINEYVSKLEEELGYVIPHSREDGTTEYLVDPDLVKIEVVDGSFSNTLELSVMTEKWISISPWYQMVYFNMLKNFFELKISEAQATGKKIRIRKEGWKSYFDILDIEDAATFDSRQYRDHSVELDPEKARFNIFPGKMTATCVDFYYDDKWIASECYNFQSSAQKIKAILDQQLRRAKVFKKTFRYFPVTLLEENLTFEGGFIVLNQNQLEEMNFVFIPKGSFQMGSPSGESGRFNDETLHTVTLNLDFEMQTTEVTQKQWEAVMKNNPSTFKGEDLPVENVSWDDVQAFIQKLNERNDGYSYRLPTEAEWEYAARAGTQTPFSFDDRVFKLTDFAWFFENSGGQTQPVAQKKPNAFGLYDIHGNVWEWVLDVYSHDYSKAVTQEKADEVQKTPRSEGSDRVDRGGGWGYGPQFLRSANRFSASPGYRYHLLGFRALRTRQESARAKCKEGEKRTTITGADFTCDTSHPALGEAWRDPDGLIWGDIVKNEDGSVRNMVQNSEHSEYMKEIGRPLPNGGLGAKEYCESIGARLPTNEEFTRLWEYMGARSGTYKGYNAQVLPNLLNNWFWSSSLDPNDVGFAHNFSGSSGNIGSGVRSFNGAVRCVVDR